MLKNFLSVLCLAAFMLLAVGSKVNKIHHNAFRYDNPIEDPAENGNYLVKNDGTKVYGEKISWKSGLLAKDQIKIDDQAFKIPEIRGYREGSTYYGRVRNEYIKRIVHGKVNVYVMFSQGSTTSTDSRGVTRTRYYTRTDHWAQRGETGPMVGMAGQKDIKEFLADCPLSVEMASLSNSKMRKAIKADPNYLNSIFDVYNNNCRVKKVNTNAAKKGNVK